MASNDDNINDPVDNPPADDTPTEVIESSIHDDNDVVDDEPSQSTYQHETDDATSDDAKTASGDNDDDDGEEEEVDLGYDQTSFWQKPSGWATIGGLGLLVGLIGFTLLGGFGGADDVDQSAADVSTPKNESAGDIISNHRPTLTGVTETRERLSDDESGSASPTKQREIIRHEGSGTDNENLDIAPSAKPKQPTDATQRQPAARLRPQPQPQTIDRPAPAGQLPQVTTPEVPVQEPPVQAQQPQPQPQKPQQTSAPSIETVYQTPDRH